jgi:hypothetical protein
LRSSDDSQTTGIVICRISVAKPAVGPIEIAIEIAIGIVRVRPSSAIMGYHFDFDFDFDPDPDFDLDQDAKKRQPSVVEGMVRTTCFRNVPRHWAQARVG